MKCDLWVQESAISRACKRLKLDGHTSILEFKKDAHTFADKIMLRWFRKNMPVKRSYLFCECLDTTFFYDQNGKAVFTYAGYVNNVKEADRLIRAIETARDLFIAMNEEMGCEVLRQL